MNDGVKMSRGKKLRGEKSRGKKSRGKSRGVVYITIYNDNVYP